ncbi:uncharacterized protein G2W53_010462 [Senna tora]|uniref:Uncharacterized protein n=1 Tax=Senna tora TaxID=362788 RepID=A0A834X131_9FABA|nr:uncharacterized protein G2W53_010462 [Senna tora]
MDESSTAGTTQLISSDFTKTLGSGGRRFGFSLVQSDIEACHRTEPTTPIRRRRESTTTSDADNRLLHQGLNISCDAEISADVATIEGLNPTNLISTTAKEVTKVRQNLR